MAEPTARALEERDGHERVSDALGAVDTLGDGQVRRVLGGWCPRYGRGGISMTCWLSGVRWRPPRTSETRT
jgi:hypothetical protein